MKRLILFLLLFGAGLGLLFFLQNQTGNPTPQDGGLTEPGEAGEVSDPSTLITVPDAPGEPEAGGSQVSVGSQIKYTRYSETTGEAVFLLVAEDSRTASAGWLELDDVTMTYPGIGVVTAAHGRIAVDAQGRLVSGDADARTGGRIELETARFVFDPEHRLAPATIVAPRFLANYDDRTVTLLDQPTWTGASLSVTGARIDLDLVRERVDAEGDTTATWLDAEGQPTLELTGAKLVVLGNDPLRTVATMSGDARLEMAPRDPLEEALVLTAPTIALVGERATEDEPFAPTEVRIEDGRGELVSGLARLSGGAFEFDFTGATRPDRVRVREDARLVLPPALWAESDSEAAVWGALTLDAADELELGTDPVRREVIARGPSVVTLGDLTLRAGGGFEGFLERASGVVHLEGVGGIQIDGALRAAAGELPVNIEHRSQALTVDLTRTIDAAKVVTQTLALDTQGPAIFAADQGPGESVRFDADEGLAVSLERRGNQTEWRLENAGGVTFDARSGVQHMAGRAAQLDELDTQSSTLIGQLIEAQGVTADGKPFEYAAQVVDAQGLDDITLEGAARFIGEGFDVRAESLQRKGASLTAEGSVVGQLEMNDQSATLSCDRLTVTGFELVGDQVTAESVVAVGNVSGTGAFEAERFDFDAARVELYDWGRTDRAQRLEITGRTRFHLVAGERDWTILADAISATSTTDQLQLVATGDLVVNETSTEFRGAGHRLTLRRGLINEAVLDGGDGIAEVFGVLPNSSGPVRTFEGTVRRIELSPERIEMTALDGKLRGFTLPGSKSGDVVSLHADSLTSLTEEWIGGLRDVLQLDGDIVMEHTPTLGLQHVFRANHITFVRFREPGDDPEAVPNETNTSFIAHGEISLRQGERFEAFGEHLEIAAPNQILRFEGTPASILYAGFTVSSSQIEIDPNTMLIESAPGTVTVDGALIEAVGPVGSNDPWILNHSGLQGRQEGDLMLEILQKPHLVVGELELNASVGLFWLDRAALESRRQLGRLDLEERRVSDVLDHLPADPAASVLREVYFEGPIEYRTEGQPSGTADAMYLDVREKRGWLSNVEMFLQRELRDRAVRWSARAEWMQRTSDGTLMSNDAVLSPCTFVDQHLVVRTEDLIVRRADENDPNSFRVNLHGNSLRAYGLFTLPLPPFAWDADEEGMPMVPELKLGSSARFGGFVQTGLNFDAEGVGDRFHQMLGAEEGARTKSDGHVGLSWLGSRGILLDLALELAAEGRYWWDIAIGGLFDDNEDRGLIQVDQDERSDLRTWFRSRGRYTIDEGQWLDLVISTESDPAVQSEFYEDEFLYFEERENYVHWRAAAGQRFFSARLKIQLDKARTQVEELPALRALIDRTAFQPFANTTLLYSSDNRLGWYRRIAGDLTAQSPFALQAPFADGGGDTHVVRADTKHRVEAPLTLPDHWKLVPFLETRASAWDQDQTETDTPTRFDLDGGARLTTLFWKRLKGGTIAQLAPFLESRYSLVHQESGGVPYLLDALDLPTGGNAHSVGLRSRFFGWREDEELDVELLVKRNEPEVGDDFDTFETFAGWQTHFFDVPVGVSHDGRYDLESGISLVSHSLLGLRPTENLGIELSHSRATDASDAPYYEAGTVRGVYRWTEKWEFEASQTLSVLEDTDLVYETILRRYGHDLIFEFGVSSIAGEGGTTFTMKVRPELLFRRSPIGYASHR